MARFQALRFDGSWIVVSDACPAPGSGPNWGAFIASYRTYLGNTGNTPLFEGATLLSQTGTNRAEFIAAILGLTALRLSVENGPIAALHVILVTDSQLVFDVATGANTAREATRSLWVALRREFDAVESWGCQVRIRKGSEGEVKRADQLGRDFRNILSPERRPPKGKKKP